MAYKDVTPPAGGKITIANGKLSVPENPILPFIRGDGTGPDIWAASVRVFDAAVQKAYDGKRKISWFEVFAGEESFKKFNNWLPDDTVEAFKEFLPAPRAMVHRRAFARETSRKGQHGYLPRKYRGHLCRH
jgi:isocitrate dehydrogenase